ncbi:C-X-C chemokine receptor type 1 [Nothobranchius furzeri]|uniref:C-X-C chemokine receptor type 1-like n=1 Tax=Nothobranchius furzeri TaxID=105023 RepID=A0A1A8AXY0_NOTFU|nr:C-X-C chemokine receptor type 1 [Nothobranchius furzeri]KAF7215057.1 C-X-C chemokine receptor type 1-like [Nothobranchius furzeri]
MKLQLFIVSLLNGLVLTTQEEGEQLNLSTDEQNGFFNINNFQSDNTTFTYDYAGGDPCQRFVPGFNSLCMMAVYIIVFVVSVLGNGLVIIVVCSMWKSRTSTDIYLMHLAVADLLFCVTLPFWATETHYGWVFGNFLCKLLSGFQELSVFSGVFLLACISVDRYFAIVRATRRLSSNHLLVKAVCGVVWLVAGLLSLPVAMKRQSMDDKDLEQWICYDNVTGESSDVWRVNMHVLHHTVGFFLPLVVMVVCYGWTLVTLFHSRNQHKHKAMRVILAVVLAFILCWLPYNITELVDTLMRGGSLNEKSCETRYRVGMTLEVTKVLAYTHCALNPVLYAFIGEKFWNQLLSALYKHGLLSKRLWVAYRKGSASSTGSIRSKQTSFSM